MTKSDFKRRDFAKLQGSLILASLTVAVGSASVYWLERQTQVAKLQLASAKARHNEADRKLQQTSNEEAELKSKTALFQQLEARRVVGPERRLDWVELIGSVRQRHRLFDINYEIAPQQPLGAAAGGYQFVCSTMTFQLPLLHEGDLDIFIGDLKREAPAIVQPQKCTLSRLAERPGNAAGANLQAICTLQWITLNTQSESHP
jgi:hypothetical protein